MAKILNAWKISEHLAKRHTNDMFFTEVKNGPTWLGRHNRIDCLAIKKSWANPCITGYEVKVSRSDFVQDNKWQAYLHMCNELYFACPKGLIALDEVPENCGLKYVYESGMIKTVKKAPYREIDHPSEMYLYLLMNYSHSAQPPFRSDRYEFWENYIEDKTRSSELGRRVKSKLAQRVVDLQNVIENNRHTIERVERDKDEYDKMIELIKEHTGSNYIYRPAESLRKLLSERQDIASSIIRRLEDSLEHAKSSFGII